MLDSPVEYQKMVEVEKTLWWYRCLHQRTIETIRTIKGLDPELRILDAACGTGGLLSSLRYEGFTKCRGFDLSSDAIQFSQSKGFAVEKGDIRETAELFSGGSFDVVVCHDALCYLSMEEVRKTLTGFSSVLDSGGIVIANLPALRAFAGMHDIAVGLKRRFSRRDIPEIVDPSLWIVKSASYWPFLLSPLIYLIRLKQKISLFVNPSADVASDVTLPSPWLNRLFFATTQLEKTMVAHAPWGSSLYIVLQKAVS